MTVFKINMLSDESENFIRTYEVPSDMNLENFHNFICDDLGYDRGVFSSIFQSNAQWNKLQEYTLADMQDDDSGVVALPMQGTTVGQVIRGRKDRLIHMFDIFAARSFFIELQEVYEAEEGVGFPRTVSGAGDPPPQFDAGSHASEDSPFDDIMSEFADFEGADDYHDDY